MLVLIADDHAIVRTGLKQILSKMERISEIHEAENGAEVLDMCKLYQYNIIILDISMPGLSGLEVLKQLKHDFPKIPILVLSIHPEAQYAFRVLKAGAAGYLTKDTAPEELRSAILKVTAGGKYITQSLAEKLATEFSNESEMLLHEQLSDREFEILLLIAAGKQPAQIAEELCISPKTVGTYRSRILSKMNLSTTTDLVRYAISHNLV